MDKQKFNDKTITEIRKAGYGKEFDELMKEYNRALLDAEFDLHRGFADLLKEAKEDPRAKISPSGK